MIQKNDITSCIPDFTNTDILFLGSDDVARNCTPDTQQEYNELKVLNGYRTIANFMKMK